MPYISTKEVKTIREAIKREFPSKDGWKFSISRENYSSVNLAIKKAPAGFEFGNGMINHFWIQDHYDSKEKAALMKMRDILNQFQGEGFEDGDYGHVPTYYINMASHIEG